MTLRKRIPKPDWQIDERPEEVYPDRGCGGDCVNSLECPYEVCVHDDRQIRAKIASHKKGVRMSVLYEWGLTKVEIAAMFGVSAQTVFRLLRLVRVDDDSD